MRRFRYYVAEVVLCALPLACALIGHASGRFCIWTQTGWPARWAEREMTRQRDENHAEWLASLDPEDRADWEASQGGIVTTTPLPDTPITVSANVSTYPTYTVRWNGAGGTFTR